MKYILTFAFLLTTYLSSNAMGAKSYTKVYDSIFLKENAIRFVHIAHNLEESQNTTDANEIHLEKPNISVPDNLGIAALQCNGEVQKYGAQTVPRFNVLHQGRLTPVEPENIAKTLRNISPNQLRKFIEAGNRIKITQLADGNFKLQDDGGLRGGCSSDWFYDSGYRTTEEEQYTARRTASINIPTQHAAPFHANHPDTNLPSTNSPQIGHIPALSTITTSNTIIEQSNDK